MTAGPAGRSDSPLTDSPLVAVVMGSASDLKVMDGAGEMLARFAVPHVTRVLSAHRTPHDMLQFAAGAADQGYRVLIAGAGGAAHLPGMLAAATSLPVIGVPVSLANLSGLDSLLSIVQMPRGVPVATVAIDGARNAGLLAVRILAVADERLRRQLDEFRQELATEARAQNQHLGQNQRADQNDQTSQSSRIEGT
jgi:5-(carboxyamino)imidazole ribonucleotide mutase